MAISWGLSVGQLATSRKRKRSALSRSGKTSSRGTQVWIQTLYVTSASLPGVPLPSPVLRSPGPGYACCGRCRRGAPPLSAGAAAVDAPPAPANRPTPSGSARVVPAPRPLSGSPPWRGRRGGCGGLGVDSWLRALPGEALVALLDRLV